MNHHHWFINIHHQDLNQSHFANHKSVNHKIYLSQDYVPGGSNCQTREWRDQVEARFLNFFLVWQSQKRAAEPHPWFIFYLQFGGKAAAASTSPATTASIKKCVGAPVFYLVSKIFCSKTRLWANLQPYKGCWRHRGCLRLINFLLL